MSESAGGSAPEDVADALAGVLGHRFRDPELLDAALTHPSHAHEREGGPGNERLEFLGDAVLGLVVARLLYELHPDWREGDLTRARAALVSTRALAGCARTLELGRYVKLGRTEQRTGGEEKSRLLGNLFEAVAGALFLDGGIEPVTRLVRRCYGEELARASPVPERDEKTRLQEWAHVHLRATPVYYGVSDSGEHEDERRYEVEVRIDDSVWGRGAARTKRAAERAAARAALRRAASGDPPADR